MPDWIVAHCLALYRCYRRFCTPYEALQQLHTTLEISRDDRRAKADWAAAHVYNWAVTEVEFRLQLVEMRYGNLDRRQRYWLHGELSEATDHLLFVRRVDGHNFWLATCSTLTCAIKRGMHYLREPQWVSFCVIRPDNSLVLEDVDARMTLDQITAQLAGL